MQNKIINKHNLASTISLSKSIQIFTMKLLLLSFIGFMSLSSQAFAFGGDKFFEAKNICARHRYELSSVEALRKLKLEAGTNSPDTRVDVYCRALDSYKDSL